MREISSGNPNTIIKVLDEPGAGGANHHYIIDFLPLERFANRTDAELPGDIKFQKGPIRENGVNGCHQEDLIAIVIDRLQSFQAGPYPCRENTLALTKLQEAMHWLNHRTADRSRRGVEGISKE